MGIWCPGWGLAKGRGSRFTGDGIKMALAIGAAPYGNRSACHAVGWDFNAPEFGDLAVGDGFQKHSYQFGIMVNAAGRRFVDEGADFRNYTYASYGRVILEQPDAFAWQIFDRKVTHLLRDEHRVREATKVYGGQSRGAGGPARWRRPSGCPRGGAGLQSSGPHRRPVQSQFRGRAAHRGPAGAEVELGEPARPTAVRGVPGDLRITFTFGGLRIDRNAQVHDSDLQPISGLYAAGELVGGLL